MRKEFAERGTGPTVRVLGKTSGVTVKELYQLFPNAVLIYQQDHVELYQSFPDPADPHACEVRVTLYAPQAPTGDRERDYWTRNLDLIDNVTTTEDFAACEKIQANLRAGAVPFLVLGRNEPGVAHFHRTLHEDWVA